MLAVALFCLFIGCIIVQCGYAGYFFVRIFRLKVADEQASEHLEKPVDIPVSIIICAHNEASNLSRNLPAIFAQRYKNAGGERAFEVIVVNDRSTDDTAAVLAGFKVIFPELKIVPIDATEERTLPGNKYPMSKGVAMASHDFLVLTDADCKPFSDYWISELMTHFYVSGPHGMITGGYGKLVAASGMLNAFSRWETLHTFLQYWSYSSRQKPYMVVGRNLACRKEALLRAQQSPLWKVTPSGDDDLLVRLTTDAFKDRRTVFIHPQKNASTLSEAKTTWGEWLRQKQRHLSTGKLYRTEIQALLAGYAFSHTAAWLLFGALLLSPFWLYALVLMSIRCAIYWCIWARVARQVDEPGLQYYFPLFDFGWMVYNFALSPFIFWKNKQQWT